MVLISKLNSLPLVEDFKSLKIGDDIYSRKYGIGKMGAIYLDDLIFVQDDRKKRVSKHESDISLIPLELIKKTNKYKYGG